MENHTEKMGQLRNTQMVQKFGTKKVYIIEKMAQPMNTQMVQKFGIKKENFIE